MCVCAGMWGDAIKDSANRKKHFMKTLPKDEKRLEGFDRLRSRGKTDRRKCSSNEQTRRQNAPSIFQEKTNLILQGKVIHERYE